MSKQLFELMQQQQIAEAFPTKKQVQSNAQQFANELIENGEQDKLEMFVQAKEMEKQQIIEAYNVGFIYPIKFDFKNNKSQDAEQYYNEIFNKNE